MASKFDGDDRVKVVELTRGDKFYFSRKYDEEKIDALIKESVDILRMANALPVAESAYRKIEELEKRGMWGTAVIEGNPLAEYDALRVLSKEGSGESLVQAELELVNIRAAYSAADRITYDNESTLLLTEDMIKEFHRILTNGLPHKYNEPGKYRNISQYTNVPYIEVGLAETGGVYKPPKLYEDVTLLMREYIKWINSRQLLRIHPLLRASLAHYHFSLIHPFWDGNGRTARLIEAVIIHASGVKYLPRIISRRYSLSQQKYYETFRQCEKNKVKDVSLFLAFFCVRFSQALLEVALIIDEEVFRVVLMDKVNSLINAKSLHTRHKYVVEAMLDHNESLTVRDYKRKLPFNLIYGNMSLDTVRRDVKRLQLHNILEQVGKGYALKRGDGILGVNELLED